MRAIWAFWVVGCTAMAASAAVAQDATYRFEWLGSGGYAMHGALSFPSQLANIGLITEMDLSCFEIQGTLEGEPVGRWALAMLEPQTTWVLTFDPLAAQFLVYGPDATMPQAWNMDGGGRNCGAGGFGFNIGNAAQDLCLDGQLLFDSQVDPSRPFPAVRAEGHSFAQDACRPELLLGMVQ